jgi:hypothetical protein
MNYQANHILIAQGMTLALLYVGIGNWAFIVPALFYSIREVYQYAIGKRHNGRFDWGGCVPVFVALVLVLLEHV